ncbi:MAG: hypothetical protein JWM10_3198 [Myxococcaceae bacterium]|nr:hypothetical protein [Myxococcaceae bacterium]
MIDTLDAIAREITVLPLSLYAQVIRKIRLALTPTVNEWWTVPLYVTAHGLTTSPMPYLDRTLSIDFDFIDHRLVVLDSDGHVRGFPLTARPVAAFCAAVFAEMGVRKTSDLPIVAPMVGKAKHDLYEGVPA